MEQLTACAAWWVHCKGGSGGLSDRFGLDALPPALRPSWRSRARLGRCMKLRHIQMRSSRWWHSIQEAFAFPQHAQPVIPFVILNAPNVASPCSRRASGSRWSPELPYRISLLHSICWCWASHRGQTNVPFFTKAVLKCSCAITCHRTRDRSCKSEECQSERLKRKSCLDAEGHPHHELRWKKLCCRTRFCLVITVALACEASAARYQINAVTVTGILTEAWVPASKFWYCDYCVSKNTCCIKAPREGCCNWLQWIQAIAELGHSF